MFYSHQLLARKAPLGQIWMAATMHAKMNRKKLNKLNIIQICEQILNPSVPMALRLSGILMGGVVIVYERKVKLLYDDVTRLLVEINEAWKVKSVPDPTLLPKGKSQAKYEAVTLPENQETELGEIEQTMASTNTLMGFQQTNYFEMHLDRVDEPFISDNGKDEAQYDQLHQADLADITMNENYESFHTKTTQYDHLERFDIEGDEEMQFNFGSQEFGQIPSTIILSPPRSQEPQKFHMQEAEEILDHHPEDHDKKQPDEAKEAVQDQQYQERPRPQKKPRKHATYAMDYEQTIIPGNIYQSWLQNASEIVSRKGRKRKRSTILPSMKISDLMDLPPSVLLCRLFSPGSKRIHYPAPLLKLWMRSTQPDHDSPSGKISPPQPPEPSSSSPPSGGHLHDPPELPSEDVYSGFGSLEKMRRTSHPFTKATEELDERLLHQIDSDVFVPEVMVTPGNSRDELPMPSSGSDHGLPSLNSGRKRAHSSSRHSGSSLEPVAEEYVVPRSDPKFKLHKVSENGFTPENDLLVETGPTQTQHQMVDQPVDQITNTIRMHLKTHFDTPGSAQTESLDLLAFGMNRKRAAHLFYHTCVMATREFIRVEQRVPFGDILISRGAKM